MPPVNKYQRYRQKCLREGRCPHCGKPCAPYAECDDRRKTKNVYRVAKRFVAAGMVSARKGERGRVWWKLTNSDPSLMPVSKVSGRDGDKRFWPKIADTPVSVEALVHAAALDVAHASSNETFTEAHVETRIGEIRATYSKRRRVR